MPDYIVRDSVLRTADRRYQAGDVITLDREQGERLVASGAVAPKPGRPSAASTERDSDTKPEGKSKA